MPPSNAAGSAPTAAMPLPTVDGSETLFLIVQALASSPFAHLADALATEAAGKGLLPTRVDIEGEVVGRAHWKPALFPMRRALCLACLPAFCRLSTAAAQRCSGLPVLCPSPYKCKSSGNRQPLSLEQLRRRYAHVSPLGLQQALALLLEHKRAQGGAALGLTSVLERGALALLPPSPAEASGPLPPPRWLRPAHSHAPRPAALLLRETGASSHAAAVSGPALLPPQRYGEMLQYQRTIRGHRFVVYCCAWDKEGRYLITGSDDRLIKVRAKRVEEQCWLRLCCVDGGNPLPSPPPPKTSPQLLPPTPFRRFLQIWSTHTHLLQATCRGHESEVTDLSVSTDSAWLASSSMDTTVRVWRLRGPRPQPGLAAADEALGAPLAVLLGHTAPVAFVDFCPTLPEALLSCSFDGTCRLWNIRDPSQPPLVMCIDSLRFGLSSRSASRLAGLGAALGPGPNSSSPAMAAAARATRHAERQAAAAAGGGGGPGAGPTTRRLIVGVTAGGAAGSAMAAAAADGREEEERSEDEAGPSTVTADGGLRLLVCGFSRDGRHIVAGASDCNVYVWRWAVPGTDGDAGAAVDPAQLPMQQEQQQQQQQQQLVAGAAAAATTGNGESSQVPPPVAAEPEASPSEPAAAAAAVAAPNSGSDGPPPRRRLTPPAQPASGGMWPAPEEACRLVGHRNDVILLQFSNDGQRFATGSKDGTVRVWRQPARAGRRSRSWEQEAAMACPPTEEAIKEARRRRRPPPNPTIDQARERREAALLRACCVLPVRHPAVLLLTPVCIFTPPRKQIAWTADDAQLVVSVTDHSVRVFDMPLGRLVHRLVGHTRPVVSRGARARWLLQDVGRSAPVTLRAPPRRRLLEARAGVPPHAAAPGHFRLIRRPRLPVGPAPRLPVGRI